MRIEWLIPWHGVEAADEQRSLQAELNRELWRGHVLFGQNVTPIARRQDCDDVLFALEDGPIALVHLTWSTHTEKVADLPWTVLYDTLTRFVEQEMEPEHRRWTHTSRPPPAAS